MKIRSSVKAGLNPQPEPPGRQISRYVAALPPGPCNEFVLSIVRPRIIVEEG